MQTETEEVQSKIGFRKESDYFSTKERRGTEGDLNSESGTTRQIKRVRTTSTGRKIMIIKENNKSEEISPFGKSGLVGLPTLIQEAKPSANSIALAKFIKEKIVLQKEKLKKGLELDAEKYSPKRRLERLMTKEFLVESPNEKSNNFVNPLSSIFENLKFEDFYKISEPNFKKLEFFENNENWNTLGEVTGLNTNEKLDYQIGFQNFQIEEHFNNEDYGVLEWRIKSEKGSVQKIYHRKSLRVFALRTINLEKFNNDPSDLHNELRTLSILSQHPHKNILRFISSRMLVSSENSQDHKKSTNFEFFTEVKGNEKAVSMSVSIVSEYGVANLKELINFRKKQGIPWQENELLILLKEIASPLAHCESLGIAHRNVKPSNIFFGEDKFTLKLVDFKLGLLLDKKQKMIETNIVGTPRYMSYELKVIYNELKKNKRKQISVKYDPYLSDVSSLGLIILEIVLISMGIEKETKLEAEFADDILEQTTEQYPYISKILKGILSNDPKQRPRFSEIEKLLQMPEENLRIIAYENRYQLLTELDSFKREDGLYIKTDLQQEFMNPEIPRAYHRLAISELTPLETKRKSSPLTKSKKDSKEKKNEKEKPAAKDNPIVSIYKDDAIDVLSYCYEKSRKQGDYQLALKMCNYLREIFDKFHKFPESPIFVYLLNNMGQMNYYLNNHQEGIELYMQAYKASKKIYGENHILSAMLLNNAGNLYYAIKQAPKAKEVYQKSMRIKETLGMKEKFTYAVALHNMANVKYSNKKINSAEEWFQSALKLYTQDSQKPGIEVAELYLALSMIYYAYLGNRVKGEEYINLAFDIFEEIEEDEMKKNLVGTAYYHLGVLHYCFKEYPEACEAYSEALTLLESAASRKDEIITSVQEHLKLIRVETEEQV